MVTEAVEKLLAELDGREPGLSGSPEAALALSLAERIDDPKNKATAASMAAGRLIETLAALRGLAPARLKETPLDEIRARRDRAVGKPAAADPVPAARRRKSS